MPYHARPRTLMPESTFASAIVVRPRGERPAAPEQLDHAERDDG